MVPRKGCKQTKRNQPRYRHDGGLEIGADRADQDHLYGTVAVMAHAFLAAGARSLIVTTRRVEDRVAAEFMRRFYARYHESRAIQAALFATRREMILDNAKPFEWAGFVLVGGLP